MKRFVAAVLSLFAMNAWAGEQAYNKAAFDKTLAEGKPAIVHFAADWCPTCKAQKPIVQSLMGEARMKNVTLFVANYDTEKTLKKKLHITQQSTFVVFKGGKEVGRSTGQTNKADLAALFGKAL
jgi:thioredoxin 1